MRPSPRKFVNVLAVDTNVLLRYFVDDIPVQAKAAVALIDRLTPEVPGFICREVVLEVVWVLERSYNFSRSRIVNAMLELTTKDGLIVENAQDVAYSLHQYGHSNDDFSDLLILAAAKRVDAQPLYTFDRKLARMDGVALLSVPQPG